MSRPLAPCGTRAAYQRHWSKGEEVCEPCRQADRAYMAELREARRAIKGASGRRKRERKPCGTRAAYQRHLTWGEEPCDACRAANNEVARAERARNAAKRAKPPRELVPCGTPGAYYRHYDKGEKPCDVCREAENERRRDRRAAAGAKVRGKYGKGRKRVTKPRPLQPCGTTAAYRRHRAAGEPPCDACREAQLAYDRGRRAKRQKRVRRNNYLGPRPEVEAGQRTLTEEERKAALVVCAFNDADDARVILRQMGLVV